MPMASAFLAICLAFCHSPWVSPRSDGRRFSCRNCDAARTQFASYLLQWEGPGNRAPLEATNAQDKMVRRSGAGDVHGGLRGDDGLGICRAVLRLWLWQRLSFERLLRPAGLLFAAGRLYPYSLCPGTDD